MTPEQMTRLIRQMEDHQLALMAELHEIKALMTVAASTIVPAQELNDRIEHVIKEAE